jgi:hypothetical protein
MCTPSCPILFFMSMSIVHYITFPRPHENLDEKDYPPRPTITKKPDMNVSFTALFCVYIRVYDVSPPTGLFPFPIPPYQWGGGGWFPLRESSSIYPRVRDFSLLTEPGSEREIAKGKNTRRISGEKRKAFLSSLLENTFLGYRP